MGRQSKSTMLARRIELADIMKDGKGYQHEWAWYSKQYGLAQKTFEEDKTAIYKAWKIEYSKDIENAKMDMLIRLGAARQRAIEQYDVKAEIQAIKLEAEILGILNKKGEQPPIVVNNNTLNIEGLSVDQIKSILYGQDDNKHISPGG